MVRALIVVLTLAAAAAQAQEASKASRRANAAAQQKGKKADVLASRAAPEPRIGQGRGSGSSGGEGGESSATRQGTANGTADCSVVKTYLGAGAPAVRGYDAPRPRRVHHRVWDQAPYVKSITHCGDLYIVQVVSQSKDAWVIDRARLEGPDGVVHVIDLDFSALQDWSINVIVAEAPPGTKLARLKLNLTGEDGRVAQSEASELP